jgi:integrase
VDGKAKQQSTKCSDLTAAKRFRDQQIGKKSRGELSSGKPETVLISELLDDVLKSDIAESTRASWRLVVTATLLPFFGDMKAARLTTDKIEQYRDQRLQKVCDATVNRELTVLRRAYNIAKRRTPPKVYNTPFFAMRKETNVRQGFLADEIYPILKDAISEPEIKLLYVIAYHTGIRKGELLALRWNSVDLEAGFIDLIANTTKNGEARRVPIFGDMMELLTAAKQWRDENFPGCPWVFHRFGKRVIDFRRVWLLATKVAGVPDLLFHDLRRTAVRNMRKASVPQVIRMKISGHKTDSMERRYNIVDDEDLQFAKNLMALRFSTT